MLLVQILRTRPIIFARTSPTRPQFALSQRWIDARRKKPPDDAVPRLRQGRRDIGIGHERQRLSLAAVPAVVVPVPPALGPNEQIQTSAGGNLARVLNLTVNATALSRPLRTRR